MLFKSIAGISKGPLQIIVVVAIAGAVVLSGPTHDRSASVIVRMDGSERVFRGDVVEGMTILDALTAATQAGNIALQVSIDQSRDSTVITRFDGREGSQKFRLFINGTMANPEKIHQTPIRLHDEVVITLL